MGYGLLRPKQRIAGTDVAGIVEAVGGNATRLRQGDDVFGWADGAFAEYVAVPEESLALKPATLTFDQAAAVPTAGTTALQGLRGVSAGDRVLVVGASGGVGTFAVQIARALGAKVSGVASARNVDLVRSTGADHVVDYTRADFTRAGPRYDLILDLVGNRPLSACRRALEPDGTLVVVGGSGVWRFARAALTSPFVGHTLRPLFSTRSHEDLETLRRLLEAGKVLPVLDRRYELGEAPEALHYLETGRARGKVVVILGAR